MNLFICCFAHLNAMNFMDFFITEGEIWSWGLNNYGQLGIGSTMKKIANPTKIAALDGVPISYIACGGYHSFAISK